MLYGVEAGFQKQPSPPSDFVPGAVHFAGSTQGDGVTCLTCDSLSCTDNGFFSFSFWTNGLSTVANNQSAIWAVDPDGDYIIAGFTFTHAAVPGCLFFGYGTSAQNSDVSFSPLTSGWHHVLGSADVNKTSGTQIMTVYKDDVKQTALGTDYAGSPVSNLVNGLEFTFGDDTSFSAGPTCDFADVWIAPGVKLHETDGTILEATRRQFVDYITGTGLVRVDPTTFPTSAILFAGDATSFATNRGTGGAFNLTGSLTDAATAPP